MEGEGRKGKTSLGPVKGYLLSLALSPLPAHVDKQTETITIPRISYAGGKYCRLTVISDGIDQDGCFEAGSVR